VCVCVREDGTGVCVCVRACVRACGCVCVCVTHWAQEMADSVDTPGAATEAVKVDFRRNRYGSPASPPCARAVRRRSQRARNVCDATVCPV
jgi:hypothetical protein